MRQRPGARQWRRRRSVAGRDDRSSRKRGPLVALTDWVLTHRRFVVVFWLAAAVAGAASASSATHALSQRSALPGKSGYEANRLIQRLYGNGGATAPFVAVLSLPSGQPVASSSARAAIARATRAVQTRVPGSRVVSYATTANPRFVSRDGRTSFALIYPPSQPDGQNPVAGALARTKAALAAASVGGSHFQVTGVEPLSSNSGGGGQGVLVETLLGAVGALVVLAFVFGSLLAFVPLLIAVVAIPTCFLIIWAITAFTSVFFVVQYLVALIGLGVAIDYSLLLVTRWREELTAGAGPEEAVHRAMATAGRSIAFSGLTVAAGLLVLIVVPVPLVRSLGLGGILIPA